MLTSPQSYEAPRTIFFVAAVCLAVLSSQVLHAGPAVELCAMAAICVAVWHGAFDNALAAEWLQPRFGRRWGLVFFPTYVLVAAGCLALWWLLPTVMLPLFLLYSAWHFGLESELRRSPGAVGRGLARGLVPIAAACYWWPGRVAAIFAQMLRQESTFSQQLTSFTGSLLWPCAGLLAVAVCVRGGGTAAKLLALLWIIAELSLSRWCTPLVAFAVYFCLWHTPDHLLSTSLDHRGVFQMRVMRRHLLQGLWPWLISLGGLGMAGWAGRHALSAYTGLVFIALSALTVPHMALAELIRRLERRPAERHSTTASGTEVLA